MSTITKSVDVEADVSTVYNQWTQFTDFPRFMDGVDRIDQVDDTHTHWTISVAACHQAVRRHDHRAEPRRAGRLEVRHRPEPRRMS